LSKKNLIDFQNNRILYAQSTEILQNEIQTTYSIVV